MPDQPRCPLAHTQTRIKTIIPATETTSNVFFAAVESLLKDLIAGWTQANQ
ncbi:MAG TPA: hypothetical protein VKH18_14810 [Terriglobales bacterium]|nr:hypothetical protein [Terriglobales bacterium]